METLSDYLLTFLLNATWQIPLVVALAALASFLLRNSPARYLHLIWVAALLGAIIIPIYSTMRRAVTASVPVAVPAVVAPPDGLESTSAASPTTSAAPGTLPEVSFSAK